VTSSLLPLPSVKNSPNLFQSQEQPLAKSVVDTSTSLHTVATPLFPLHRWTVWASRATAAGTGWIGYYSPHVNQQRFIIVSWHHSCQFPPTLTNYYCYRSVPILPFPICPFLTPPLFFPSNRSLQSLHAFSFFHQSSYGVGKIQGPCRSVQTLPLSVTRYKYKTYFGKKVSGEGSFIRMQSPAHPGQISEGGGNYGPL